MLLTAERFPAQKATWLIHRHRKPQPGLKRIVVRRHIMTPMAVPFFKSQRVHGMKTRQAKAKGFSGLHQRIVNRQGFSPRHIKFPAELAHVGDAQRQYAGPGHFNLLSGREGEFGVRPTRCRDRGQTRAGVRAHHAQHGVIARHIFNLDAGLGPQVPSEPSGVPGARCGGAHHPEAVFREPGDGQIGLDPALRIEPRRVDDSPNVHIDVVRA